MEPIYPILFDPMLGKEREAQSSINMNEKAILQLLPMIKIVIFARNAFPFSEQVLGSKVPSDKKKKGDCHK